ncbi:MAG TPA: serine--tRNA ligase [Coxiellaceae bacterium]|nr:serine--tRNA ligase [Coxiellaceae bacterium]HBS51597.1 serine--tRNA ligase [Coxiellaceae bacterium]HBY55420.1 serine--tRNA ligase [Coxiellaceae bacterium]
MLDPKYFRQELEETAKHLKKRGLELDVPLIQQLEEKRRLLQVEVQNLQNERNQRSKEVGLAKAKGTDVSLVIADMHGVGAKLEISKAGLDDILTKLDDIYQSVPNLPHKTVPEGASSEDNVEIRRVGKPRSFSFTPKDHVALGTALGMMDFENAAKITGARFVVLYDKLAKLQRALIRFMLDVHTKEHGYKEVYVPNLVNATSLFGTGQLPKMSADLFHIEGDFKYSLIPTGEVPITNLVRDEIILEEKLPLKYVAHTPCYRSEAGSYGKDLRGIIRQHQFEKVELVRMEKPQNSYQAHEEITMHAEKILQKLELPYRVMALCTGDIGFASAKTYDLEVWFPEQAEYREISSCSNFESFQARRMKARFRDMQTGKVELLHTLNASGLALPRTIVAIMENYQDAKGNIHLPEVLWEYMDGERCIKN